MKTALSALGLTSLSLALAAAANMPTADAGNKPNIAFILMDKLGLRRGWMLMAAESPAVPTPRIDKLATQGRPVGVIFRGRHLSGPP